MHCISYWRAKQGSRSSSFWNGFQCTGIRSSDGRHPEHETGQSSTVRDVSKDQALVKKVSLPVLGTDEGRATLNLRLETFERKKSIGWYPCCSSIIQCALMDSIIVSKFY